MKDRPETNAVRAESPARDSLRSDDLRLQLECPKCKTPAWVFWRQLPHLLRCPKCRNSFWINKNGHVESEHECGTTRITCPRCQESHEWPAEAKLKHLRCRGCSFDIAPTDGEAPSMAERLAGGSRTNTARSRKHDQRESKELSRAVIFGIVIGTFSLLGLLVAGVAWAIMPDKELTRVAGQFTVASALGETEKALEAVDPGQQAAYERWCAINFASRSLGSQDRLEVSIKSYTSTRATVHAQLGSGSKDRIVLKQVWRKSPEGRWQFDADSTLKGEGGETP
jgi:predicted Zn-ribbon and HTH transcriptional regulator